MKKYIINTQTLLLMWITICLIAIYLKPEMIGFIFFVILIARLDLKIELTVPEWSRSLKYVLVGLITGYVLSLIILRLITDVPINEFLLGVLLFTIMDLGICIYALRIKIKFITNQK